MSDPTVLAGNGSDESGGNAPLDRFGNPTGDRARDRKGVIAFMARNGVAANLLMIFMLVAGIAAYNSIVQEVFPETSQDAITVSVTYPGATPEEVEESIVQKIEEAVQAVDDVKKVTGTASEGRGSVVVELEAGADMARALDDVKSEVDQIQTFPADAEEPDVRENTTRQTVMRIALYGDVSERTLKETAYQLEDQLAALPQINYVSTSAVRQYQVFIDVPQERLQALGLSLTDISRIVSQNSLDSPAGSVETDREQVRVRTVGQNYSQQDFENIILRTRSDGTILRLGDVATITDGFEDNDLITRFNGQPAAFVDVYRTSDERVLDVANAAISFMEEDSARVRPPGVEYALWNDESKQFEGRLSLLVKNAGIGLVLVLVALTLFLDVRLAFWTALGIGATFVGAIYVIGLTGTSLNMFSLFGFIVALGLVVDDAVVVGENIYAERERGRSGVGAAIVGAERVRVPVIFAVATTIVAFSPLLVVGGTIGKVLADIPLVVIAVLALSLVEALLILPYHLSHLPAAGAHTKNRFLAWFERVQKGFDRRLQAFIDGPLDRGLQLAVNMPYLVVSGALALLIVIGALVPAGIIKLEFFPEIEADVVSAQLEMPSGSSVERTADVAALIETAADRALARFSEQEEGYDDVLVASYTTIGLVEGGPSPIGGQASVRPDVANIQYSLLPAGERDFSASDFEKAWREEIGELREARSISISSSLVSAGAPVNVRVSHHDREVLEEATTRLMSELTGVTGVFDIESDQDDGVQQVDLTLKPSARTLGLSLQDLAGQVRAAFFGAEAVRIQRGREDVRVYVRLPEEQRDSVPDIGNYRVRVAGGQVPLSSLADISITNAPTSIQREDGYRIHTVTADLDTDAITSQEMATLLKNEILPSISADYPGLQFEFGGEQEQQQESFGDIGSAFLLALAGIYALLAIPFRSYVQPIIIMAAIPFGMIGALIGHVLLGISLGILSMFGIIALSGVVINGALVLIDFINENLEAGMDRKEAIIDAAKSRFRPIILTAITTFLGVAPITFESDLQAQILIPMSTSLGFGILFGTIMQQLLIPALAILQMRAVDRIKAWFDKSEGDGGEEQAQPT